MTAPQRTRVASMPLSMLKDGFRLSGTGEKISPLNWCNPYLVSRKCGRKFREQVNVRSTIYAGTRGFRGTVARTEMALRNVRDSWSLRGCFFSSVRETVRTRRRASSLESSSPPPDRYV